MATDAIKSGDTQVTDEKVTFTAEQQAKIEEIIKETQGRAARELRTQLDSQSSELSSLKSELDSAKAALAKASTPEAKKAAKGDIDELQNQIEEMKTAGARTRQEYEDLQNKFRAKDQEVQTANNKLMQFQKKLAMSDAASKASFVNTDAALKLTDEFVRWDDTRGRFIVTNESGTERMNAAYEPMSLEEFYQEYGAKNPWLVASGVRSGTGASESARGISSNGKYSVEQIFGKNSDSKLANQLAKENMQEYHRLKKIAKDNGLIR